MSTIPEESTTRGADAPAPQKSAAKSVTYDLYPMDTAEFRVNYDLLAGEGDEEGNPYYVTFYLRKPTETEEEVRETKLPVITREKGKVKGGDAANLDTPDIEAADAWLFDKIAYQADGFAPFDGSGDEPVDNQPLTKEALAQISAMIKSRVIQGMYRSRFILEQQDVKKLYTLGASRQWVIRQEVGSLKQEDGTWSAPTHVIRYFFREPTEKERKKHRKDSIVNNLVRLNAGGAEEQRTTNLRVVRDLFDACLTQIEGAGCGEPIQPLDIRDPAELRAIPGVFKKAAWFKLFDRLQGDLGNS